MDEIMNFQRNEEDDLYAILGCDETSSIWSVASTEQILAEYKAKALDLHPDKNISDETSVSNFQRLLRAKEILTDPEKRHSYDKWRNSGISMTYEQWCNLSKAAHTSMHWAGKKQKEPMLCGSTSQSSCQGDTSSSACSAKPKSNCSPKWKRENADSVSLLNKFRNYEI